MVEGARKQPQSTIGHISANGSEYGVLFRPIRGQDKVGDIIWNPVFGWDLETLAFDWLTQGRSHLIKSRHLAQTPNTIEIQRSGSRLLYSLPLGKTLGPSVTKHLKRCFIKFLFLFLVTKTWLPERLKGSHFTI